ncbi:tissue alpha-L-fucosidase-like, partial [Vombatus ursinus]|uniref:tissue alpha-L-fucosidase-like n=1 Tax=Vombatus ursinus TaxID=29139 RepID=UPI000FFCEF2C
SPRPREAPDTYWNSTKFLAWLYNDSPVKDQIVLNDRWGKDNPCKHGGYLTCRDHYKPKNVPKHKGEMCTRLDNDAWAYQRNMNISEVMTFVEVILELIEVVSFGGNYLLNVGLTKDGMIAPIFQERLRCVGNWLSINGEGIFATKPWRVQMENIATTVSCLPIYNTKESAVYAFFNSWPQDGMLELTSPVLTEKTMVTMLGDPGLLKGTEGSMGKGLIISLPQLSPGIANMNIWTFKLQEVQGGIVSY